MDAMLDLDRIQEIKDRLADRYTTLELVELLNVPVEDIIEMYWDLIVSVPVLLDEVDATQVDKEEDE